ncbi:hypothetical protein NFI96_017091, partial [Prochilodus magdalenae]
MNLSLTCSYCQCQQHQHCSSSKWNQHCQHCSSNQQQHHHWSSSSFCCHTTRRNGRYVTASKVILLARGLQKITSNVRRAVNLTDSVELLVVTICQQMSHRFHKIESHALLSEAAALDPKFKKKAFGKDEDADRVYRQLCNAAAR